jgi:hypothetical protein
MQRGSTSLIRPVKSFHPYLMLFPAARGQRDRILAHLSLRAGNKGAVVGRFICVLIPSSVAFYADNFISPELDSGMTICTAAICQSNRYSSVHRTLARSRPISTAPGRTACAASYLSPARQTPRSAVSTRKGAGRAGAYRLRRRRLSGSGENRILRSSCSFCWVLSLYS